MHSTLHKILRIGLVVLKESCDYSKGKRHSPDKSSKSRVVFREKKVIVEL